MSYAKFWNEMIPYTVITSNQVLIEFELRWKNRSLIGILYGELLDILLIVGGRQTIVMIDDSLSIICYFAEYIFKLIFLNETYWILV